MNYDIEIIKKTIRIEKLKSVYNAHYVHPMGFQRKVSGKTKEIAFQKAVLASQLMRYEYLDNHMEITPKMWQWLGGRGARAKKAPDAIFTFITGFDVMIDKKVYQIIKDRKDLSECIEMFEVCPELYDKFKKMKKACPTWKNIVENWELLIEMYYDNNPDLDQFLHSLRTGWWFGHVFRCEDFYKERFINLDTCRQVVPGIIKIAI